MSLSWTCCDCCGSREGVELVDSPLPGWGVGYRCARCRGGLCPDCGST